MENASFELDGILIKKGDCLEMIQSLEDASMSLTITSPPYFIGKEYDRSRSFNDFIRLHEKLIPEIVKKTKLGGSICWQVGYHINNGSVTPLDYPLFKIFENYPEVELKNRIIWTFGHGLHSKNKFSGRHEMILWYIKKGDYTFNLDDIRIPQKYPGKKHYRGSNKGEFSGNPLGKNPSDVWNIPNVKANHIEKTAHPCQFPIALVQRLIKGLTNENDMVCDPFLGTGTSAVASYLENRRFIGYEIDNKYFDITVGRLTKAIDGKLKVRPLNKPVHVPNQNTSVAQKPEHFKF